MVYQISVGFHRFHPLLNEIIRKNSDIITFHNYFSKFWLKIHINRLKRLKRPIICTEWLNRPLGSTVEKCLPLFREENVGCFHWGLVNGKSQAHCSWFNFRPRKWQHDLFYGNYKPYDKNEIEVFKNARKRNSN